MQGGELLDQIVDAHAFSEREAAEIMYSVVKTVNFLHQEGVCKSLILLFLHSSVADLLKHKVVIIISHWIFTEVLLRQ